MIEVIEQTVELGSENQMDSCFSKCTEISVLDDLFRHPRLSILELRVPNFILLFLSLLLCHFMH